MKISDTNRIRFKQKIFHIHSCIHKISNFENSGGCQTEGEMVLPCGIAEPAIWVLSRRVESVGEDLGEEFRRNGRWPAEGGQVAVGREIEEREGGRASELGESTVLAPWTHARLCGSRLQSSPELSYARERQ
jgi:hypothetical protein